MHNFPDKNYLFPILNKVFNRIPTVILLKSKHSIWKTVASSFQH